MGCINRSKVNTPKSFPGSKSMSSRHMPMGKGKMSGAHGVVTAKQTTGMYNTGGDRVGAGKSGFSSGRTKQGPCPIGGKGHNSKSY